ncbi:MAG: PEP-CTERM sorting domain-containing protein [Burkholderiales bacterium]|nr:PEP-CTERM sorting domain-containing protein [Burkholderiales bacterium]
MKFSQVLKSVAVAAALAAGGAQAATVANATGTGTLIFTDAVISAFAAGGVAISPIAPATWTAPAATTPVGEIVVNGSNAVQSVTTSGGLYQQSTPNFTNTGGNISVTNLKVDFTSNTIYANVSGANGLVANPNLALFTFSTVTGATTIAGPGTYNTTISGLSMTAAGKAAYATGLGLNAIGQSVLGAISDYGRIESSITVSAVPEPSTYALMGIGLAGVAFMARRRKNAA